MLHICHVTLRSGQAKSEVDHQTYALKCWHEQNTTCPSLLQPSPPLPPSPWPSPSVPCYSAGPCTHNSNTSDFAVLSVAQGNLWALRRDHCMPYHHRIPCLHRLVACLCYPLSLPSGLQSPSSPHLKPTDLYIPLLPPTVLSSSKSSRLVNVCHPIA